MSEERHLRFEVLDNKAKHPTARVKDTVPGNARLEHSRNSAGTYTTLMINVNNVELTLIERTDGSTMMHCGETKSWRWHERELRCERHWVVVEV